VKLLLLAADWLLIDNGLVSSFSSLCLVPTKYPIQRISGPFPGDKIAEA
jgi:hypothetical protein